MEKGRGYQITIRKGLFGFVVFRKDATHAKYDEGLEVKNLAQATEKLTSWIQSCSWGRGPCRLRDLDADTWTELGMIG
jgi:hypothetical protein